MSEKTHDLVMLTRGHIVVFGDDGKITVLERVSHNIVYHGPPSGSHPISAAARRINELAMQQQLPAEFPVWEPYPHDKPTVETFALYHVPAGALPSRDLMLYFREATRRPGRSSRRARRRK